MHILMIAPEPFFEPRGTPFSEFHRIRALTTLGHTIDLVTYPFGRSVEMAGLRIHRSMRPPFVSHIGIGPSWKKVPLDLMVALTALRLALTRRYDAVHSHEEGGAIGVVLAKALRVPHLYDMHSSLPQQITNFGYGRWRWLTLLFTWIERLMIRHSRVVIVICPELELTVRAVDQNVPAVLIENAPGSGDAPQAGTGAAVRESLGVMPETPVILYTGTFEAYQGLDLLYDAMSIVARERPDARLVMVGGEPAQVEKARAMVRGLGIETSVIFTGQRPFEEVPAYLDAADILASPRSTGTNTPLKIYQYLRSGRAVVATRLRTHTQVLSDDTAFLADPTPAAFAAALLAAIRDPAAARAVGDRAKTLAEAKYSDAAYIAKTKTAMSMLGEGVNHYSYTHYASDDVAQGFDALRFSGPIGHHLLDTQQRILLEALNPGPGRRLLDVGTGTGRAAIALARAGASVVGVDASEQMLEVARSRAADAKVDVEFHTGDAHAIPFPDRSFDAAVSLRVIMHTPDWERCIRELCRVSRSRVMVDFPAAGSAALAESVWRRLVHALGGRTEPYRVIRERALRLAFLRSGFHIVSTHRQFVLPIAFHKAVASLGFTLALERTLETVGLRRWLGSPVTMVAER